jgi:hypothetical protein
MSDLSHGSPPEQYEPVGRPRRDWLANALIPALAALAGALIGAVASVFITIYQLNANQHQAVDNFLRSQRQSQYAIFLADSNELWHSTALAVLNNVQNNSSVNLLIRKVTSDYYDVAILGPTNVAVDSYRISVDASCIGEDKHIGTYGYRCGYTPIEDLNKLASDLANARRDMTQVISSN